MIRFLRNIWKDRRGNALIIMGASLPVLVGAAGLGTDMVQWVLWKRELQRAADSAAMAGVYDRISEGNTSNTEAAVCNDLDLNNHTLAGSGCDNLFSKSVSFPANDATKKNQVQVTLKVRMSLPFSSMFLSTIPPIAASATAAGVEGNEYCVIALDRSASAVGINIGGSATIDMGDCSMIANSSNPNNAATNTGNASAVTAKSLDAAGGVQHSSNWNVDSYNPYSTPVDDPFASLKTPKSSDCNQTISIGQNQSVDRTSDNNKVVCLSGGLTVGGTVKLGSATYVINGDLVMHKTSASLTCNGCTIILTGSADINGGTLTLTAPTTDGDYKGIALYQTRTGSTTGTNRVNGNNGASIQGVVYFPRQPLDYNGGATADYKCLQIVARLVTFSGNSNMKAGSQCGDAGLNTIGGGLRVRLVA